MRKIYIKRYYADSKDDFKDSRYILGTINKNDEQFVIKTISSVLEQLGIPYQIISRTPYCYVLGFAKDNTDIKLSFEKPYMNYVIELKTMKDNNSSVILINTELEQHFLEEFKNFCYRYLFVFEESFIVDNLKELRNTPVLQSRILTFA